MICNLPFRSSIVTEKLNVDPAPATSRDEARLLRKGIDEECGLFPNERLKLLSNMVSYVGHNHTHPI
jgi:hypothetical protein